MQPSIPFPLTDWRRNTGVYVTAAIICAAICRGAPAPARAEIALVACFLGVLAASYRYGRTAAAGVVLIGTAMTGYWALPPVGSLVVAGARDQMLLAFFLIASTVATLLVYRQRRAAARTATLQREVMEAQALVRSCGAHTARMNRECTQLGAMIRRDVIPKLQRVQNRLNAIGDATGPVDLEAALGTLDCLVLYACPGAERREIISARNVVSDVVHRLKVVKEQTGAVITVDALPFVPADATQLGQVFEAVIQHAMRSTPEGKTPQIHVGGEFATAEWRFSIKNNGAPVIPMDRELMFELGGTPRSDPALAACRRIIEHNGGRVGISNHAGGTTFWFTWQPS